MHEKFGSDSGVLERFVEEAQIGGQLQHPDIVPVYELGLQRPYFAMKLVKGETLAAQLQRRADPSEDRRRYFGVFEQICQTMAYAHTRRVVHRDLKPANVMIGAFGEVQVVDWGFAKVLANGGIADEVGARREHSERSEIETVRSSSDSGTTSVAGSLLGTPAYMPPEQANGDVDRMDQRSDVFGLGGINAACCAILAGFGHGEDAGELSSVERRALRDRAYDFFAKQLNREIVRIDKRSEWVPRAENRLSWWQRDKKLDDVRDPDELAKLGDEAARWRQLWDDVAATLERAADPAQAIRWLQAAETTYDRGDYGRAARAYSKALIEYPFMREVDYYRYNMACSLALAAAGKGKGADELSAERRAEMRAEAHAHLAEELAFIVNNLETGKKRDDMIDRLKHWPVDGDFAGVRGAALDALPDDEAEPWRELWEEVELTLEVWGS